MNPVAGKEADRQIDKLFEDGMIELLVSNYNSPLVLVKKPNNCGFQLCVNYIKLNKVLQHIFFPVPCIDTLLSDLHGEKLKSTLDLQDAFWSVELAPESREMTSFTSYGGVRYHSVGYRWAFNRLLPASVLP